MQVSAAQRPGGQGIPEPGPQRGQHQHRGPAGVAQQLPQPGGDPLAQPGLGRVEVELGLVQPHHGPRPDARQLGQRRIGAGRVDRMPQPPRRVLVSQQGQRFPAGPGLARGGPADQHRDPAAPARRRAHHLAQHLIMLARYVRRQVRQPRWRVLGLDRPVHLQGERVGDMGERYTHSRAHRRPGILAGASVFAHDAEGGQLGGDHGGELLRGPAAQVHRNHVRQQARQGRVIEAGGEHVLLPCPYRPVQRSPALQPGPVLVRVLGRNEHHGCRGALAVDGRQFFGQVLSPQVDLLISVIEAAHPPRPQHIGDLLDIAPLGAGERQRHIPPPPRPGTPARAAVPSRHATRVCHQPGPGNTTALTRAIGVSPPPGSVGVTVVSPTPGAGAERRRSGGLPGDRVGSCPGEPVPGRVCGGTAPRATLAGPNVEADVGDPDLDGGVARGTAGPGSGRSARPAPPLAR